VSPDKQPKGAIYGPPRRRYTTLPGPARSITPLASPAVKVVRESAGGYIDTDSGMTITVEA